MADENLKISVEEAKDHAISVFKKITDYIEKESKDGMISSKNFFNNLKENLTHINWKKTPDWLNDNDDDIDRDSMGC